jgi:hypothetical protein
MNFLKHSRIIQLVPEVYLSEGTPLDYVHEVMGISYAKFAVLLSRGWVHSGV